MTSELLWYTSRAGGIASIVLLTLVVILGTLLSSRRARPVASTVRMAVHRWLSLALVVFLAVHIVTAVAEGYVKIGWLAVVVPFVSGWQPVWVGLGAVSVDLMVALLVSSWLRHAMPERVWRALHWLTYGLWPAALVHGFMLGTPQEPVLRAVTVACAALGLGAIVVRSRTSHRDRDRRRDVLAGEWT